MPENVDKAIVKEAIREVIDEFNVKNANGSGPLLDTITKATSDVADAFEHFFAATLSPAAASVFVDLRMRNAKLALKLLQAKISQLEKEKSRLSKRARRR